MRSTATMHGLRQERKGTVRHPCRRHNFVLTIISSCSGGSLDSLPSGYPFTTHLRCLAGADALDQTTFPISPKSATSADSGDSGRDHIAYLEHSMRGYELLQKAYLTLQKEVRDLREQSRRLDPIQEDAVHQWGTSTDGVVHDHGHLILGELPGTCRHFGNASPAYTMVSGHSRR